MDELERVSSNIVVRNVKSVSFAQVEIVRAG